MDRAAILAFLRARKLAVEATLHEDNGGVQAAVVGVVVNDALELFFDTLDDTRKLRNLVIDPRIAFVFHDDVRTVQIEGVADFPQGEALERWYQRYIEVFPDGVERRSWPGIAYVVVRPRWIRASDYSTTPPTITTLELDDD
jgi:general stress protein 26